MKTWQCNNEYCGSNFKCVVITADDARPNQCPISWNSPQEFNEIGTIKNPEQETDA
jgi:hypothetical protein